MTLRDELDLDAKKPASFLARQFTPEATPAQIRFDIVCGILLPLVCLCLDPLVFREGVGAPLLGEFRVVSGLVMGLGMGSLAAWLFGNWPAALLTGFLTGGAIFAGLLGLVMLPFTLIGLFVLIGILGFSPFAVSFVFSRNAMRAYRKSRQTMSRRRVLYAAAVGLALSCGAPWAAQAYVDSRVERALTMALSPDEDLAAHGRTELKRVCRLTRYLDISEIYDREGNPARRQRLQQIDEALGREGIEVRRTAILD